MSAAERAHAIAVQWAAASELTGEAKVAAREPIYAEAKALVAEEPSYFAHLEGLDIPRLVRLVDAAREAGDIEDVERIGAYLKAAHEPQQIGGRLGGRGR